METEAEREAETAAEEYAFLQSLRDESVTCCRWSRRTGSFWNTWRNGSVCGRTGEPGTEIKMVVIRQTAGGNKNQKRRAAQNKELRREKT